MRSGGFIQITLHFSNMNAKTKAKHLVHLVQVSSRFKLFCQNEVNTGCCHCVPIEVLTLHSNVNLNIWTYSSGGFLLLLSRYKLVLFKKYVRMISVFKINIEQFSSNCRNWGQFNYASLCFVLTLLQNRKLKRNNIWDRFSWRTFN